MPTQNGTGESRKIALGQNQVLWLSNVCCPNPDFLLPGFCQLPLTPWTKFQRTTPVERFDLTTIFARPKNLFLTTLEEIVKLIRLPQSRQLPTNLVPVDVRIFDQLGLIPFTLLTESETLPNDVLDDDRLRDFPHDSKM